MSRFDNSPNYGLIILAAVLAGLVSSFVTYKASSNNANFAVVDLQRVITASKDVASLKNERDTQIQDLKKMADTANEKIKSVNDDEAKKKVSEQYLAEINAKKADYDKIYAAALQASDQKLNDIINSVAEKNGLTAVLNKAYVVRGGTDITDAVVDLVN